MIFGLFNKVKFVVVFVLGDQKKDIVKIIFSVNVDIWNYFIIGFDLENGELIWFIDNVVFDSY